MRNIILVLLLTTSFHYTFGQKIVKNEIDEFTGKAIIETSWETLNRKTKLYSYVRFRKIDNSTFLFFRMGTGSGNKAYSVENGEVLFLKFTDDEILKLTNHQYQITSVGGGAIGLIGSKGLGLELSCKIDEEILLKLKDKTIAKVRVYTSEGYAEAEVNKKHAENFKDLAKLIN